MNRSKSTFRVLFLSSFLGLFLLEGLAWAGPPPVQPASVVCAQENRAVGEYFAVIERAKKERPDLVAALAQFPKGADVHNHLSGTVMAEDYIALAAKDGDCFGQAPGEAGTYTIKAASGGTCPPAFKPVAQARAEEKQDMVRSLSMYGFNDKEGRSIQAGHDHFFDAFGRFGAVAGAHHNMGAMLALMLRQAHGDHVAYVETQIAFRHDETDRLASLLREKYPDAASYKESANYPAMLDYLTAKGLNDVVAASRQDVAAYVEAALAALRCGTPAAEPACQVSFDFQAAVNRNSSLKDGSPDLAKLFTQVALYFLLADRERRVVGVNLVAPEDGSVSMASFVTQMAFFKFFHEKFPRVNIALHGGEITPCFMGPGARALKDHLAGSIRAGAKRLGHAVSFAYLDDADRKEVAALMREMDASVEIMFTSNAQILGVAGAEHPFTQYFRTYGIPTVFATDDEGVSHGDFTNEWIYGAARYKLTFTELKRLARTSLQVSFLPGAPLWRDLVKAEITDQCKTVIPGSPNPAEPCKSFLEKSPKAEMQWRHEAKLAAYEKEHGATARKHLGD